MLKTMEAKYLITKIRILFIDEKEYPLLLTVVSERNELIYH